MLVFANSGLHQFWQLLGQGQFLPLMVSPILVTSRPRPVLANFGSRVISFCATFGNMWKQEVLVVYKQSFCLSSSHLTAKGIFQNWQIP